MDKSLFISLKTSLNEATSYAKNDASVAKKRKIMIKPIPTFIKKDTK